MKILAVEFSSPQRSVALVEQSAEGGTLVLASAAESGGRNAHAFALIEEGLSIAKMQREEIGCIAIGIGPGSYGGIRAAIALAQGWQLAQGIKLLGISSVEVIAAQSQGNGIRGRINVVVDAQRNEFYLAGYELSEDGISEIETLRLATAAEVETRIAKKEIVIGLEADKWNAAAQNVFPDAATLGRLAAGKTNFVPGEKLEPIYLRETNFVKALPPRLISNG